MEQHFRLMLIFITAILHLQGSPVPFKQNVMSQLTVGEMQPERSKEYIQMFFMPSKKVVNPKSNFRYTVGTPLVRDDLPQDLLDRATHVNFDDMHKDIVTNDTIHFFVNEEAIMAKNDLSEEFLVPSLELIKTSMEEVFNYPRNMLVSPQARDIVGSYIYEKMGRSGLIITIQDFKHEMPLKAFADLIGAPILGNTPSISGSNIIGILPGKFWNTKKDRPLIIGAHWDTVVNSTGFNDNGSGVAVMLEIARVLTRGKCFQPDYTILFTAFDSEEDGSFGSQEFLNKIIVPHFIRQGVNIQGAIILDTVFNYDAEPGSQRMPDLWENLVPEAKKSIEKNGNKGDFLAIIGRNHPDERKMSDLIHKWATLDGLKTQEFNLKSLPPYHEPSIESLQQHSYFWQSDNSRFWFYKEDEEFMSFPAVLLTDTAFHRGYMKKCYHSDCDQWNQSIATDDKYKFMTATAQSLVFSIAEMTMEDHANSCIKKTVQHIIEKASSIEVVESVIPLNIIPSTDRPKRWTTTEELDNKTTTPVTIKTTKTTSTPKTTTTKAEEKITTTPKPDLVEMEPTTVSTPNQNLHALYPDAPINNEISDEYEKNPDFPGLEDLQNLLKDELKKIMPTAINSANGIGNTLVPSIGTQINIENLNIDMSSKSLLDHEDGGQCLVIDQREIKAEQGLVLGSGQVDNADLLSKVVKNFFSNREKTTDRRKYKGKHKNSPMVIKFL